MPPNQPESVVSHELTGWVVWQLSPRRRSHSIGPDLGFYVSAHANQGCNEHVDFRDREMVPVVQPGIVFPVKFVLEEFHPIVGPAQRCKQFNFKATFERVEMIALNWVKLIS